MTQTPNPLLSGKEQSGTGVSCNMISGMISFMISDMPYAGLCGVTGPTPTTQTCWNHLMSRQFLTCRGAAWCGVLNSSTLPCAGGGHRCQGDIVPCFLQGDVPSVMTPSWQLFPKQTSCDERGRNSKTCLLSIK
jgi:hypothetical protein